MRTVLPLPQGRSIPLPDAALALTLFAAGQAEAWVPFHTSLGGGSDGLAALAGAVMTLPLAFRRTSPLGVAVAVCVPIAVLAGIVEVRLLFFGGLLPLLVVVYTLAAHAARRPLVALPFVALALVEAAVPAFRKPGEIVFDWLWFGVAAALGFVVRARSVRAERSDRRVAALEVERDTVLREERARIARELHDVIAHSVSVIVIQAGAAEPLVDEDPAKAREALASIRATASDALGEMRRLLGILRERTDELELAPQPSITQLDPLLAQARTATLDVSLRVEGEPRRLPGGVDLAAYRIVQEALTNTRKHAAAREATVVLRYTQSAVEVEVSDDGTAAASNGVAGHGLVGMRERVALYGGSLVSRPRKGGGFEVHATLPTS